MGEPSSSLCQSLIIFDEKFFSEKVVDKARKMVVTVANIYSYLHTPTCGHPRGHPVDRRWTSVDKKVGVQGIWCWYVQPLTDKFLYNADHSVHVGG